MKPTLGLLNEIKALEDERKIKNQEMAKA